MAIDLRQHFLFVRQDVLAASSNCGGLTNVDTDLAKLVFPPIAKAAHVEGLVLLLVKFSTDGNVSGATAVSGPFMLRASAANFVWSWHVNTFTGPRTCPIAISYHLNAPGTEVPASANTTDAQHVTIYSGSPPIETPMYAVADVQHFAVTGSVPCLCDPPGVLRRKRRFGIF